MIYPEADKLETWGSKYSLVVLAAKRAKQIKSGAPRLIETDSVNPLTIALEEIAAGKVNCTVPDNDIIIKTEEEPVVARLLAVGDEEDIAPSETLVVDEEEDIFEDEEVEEEEVVLDDESDEEEEVVVDTIDVEDEDTDIKVEDDDLAVEIDDAEEAEDIVDFDDEEVEEE